MSTNMSTKRAATGATGTTGAPKRRKTIPIFSTTHCINRVPEFVWQKEIISYLDLMQFSKMRCHSSFNKYWHEEIAKNIIRVPQGCPTVEKAMRIAMIFLNNARSPLKIVLDKGNHKIMGNAMTLNVTCSHITFIGKGKNQTTIRGGFKVFNQQDVKFEEVSITNPARMCMGLHLRGSETNVDVLKCIVKECRLSGMYVDDGATVTAEQCEFMENGGNGVSCHNSNTKVRLNDCQMHHNGGSGLQSYDHAVVDLHGTKTDIHSNKQCGICASSRGKVNIHLPSQHNTSHDNVGEDRNEQWGGSIANINADGTFTHT